MNEVELLERSRERLADPKRLWSKGCLRDGRGANCAYGAIIEEAGCFRVTYDDDAIAEYAASFGPEYPKRVDVIVVDETHENYETAKAAAARLADVLPHQSTVWDNDFTRQLDRIFNFNDSAAETVEEVVAAFDNAIAKAKRSQPELVTV